MGRKVWEGSQNPAHDDDDDNDADDADADAADA